jgi:hypothetical protein
MPKTFTPATPAAKLDQIIDLIEDLMEIGPFMNEMHGEDEGMLNTALDFFIKLHEDLTASETVHEDPILWREQQDAETD